MNWDFFERRVCLTTVPEEWAKAEREFARVGLTAQKFQSLPIDTDQILGPHQSFSGSVRRILTEFWGSGDKTLLHLEDDCEFKDLHHLEDALNELPDDWDIVYLGANLVLWNNGEPWPERYSDRLFRLKCAWTTHAIGYRKKCVRTLLEKQPEFSVQMFDNYLSNRLSELNAFIVAPMVAYQRPRFSSIWGRVDDYTPIFEASDARLK